MDDRGPERGAKRQRGGDRMAWTSRLSADRVGGSVRPRRVPRAIWLGALAIALLGSCERTPTKSDYVSARVSELCEGQESDALRACRIAVIKQFADVPLEELQRRYPKPEPRPRPSCGL